MPIAVNERNSKWTIVFKQINRNSLAQCGYTNDDQTFKISFNLWIFILFFGVFQD